MFGPMHDHAGIDAAAEPRQPTLYERRVEALLSLLADSGEAELVEAHRRTMEALRQDMSEGAAWYDRRLQALRDALEELGILDRADIEAHLAGEEGGRGP